MCALNQRISLRRLPQSIDPWILNTYHRTARISCQWIVFLCDCNSCSNSGSTISREYAPSWLRVNNFQSWARFEINRPFAMERKGARPGTRVAYPQTFAGKGSVFSRKFERVGLPSSIAPEYRIANSHSINGVFVAQSSLSRCLNNHVIWTAGIIKSAAFPNQSRRDPRRCVRWQRGMGGGGRGVGVCVGGGGGGGGEGGLKWLESGFFLSLVKRTLQLVP